MCLSKWLWTDTDKTIEDEALNILEGHPEMRELVTT